jgi:hypothetical protein
LAAEASGAIGQLDIELGSTLDNSLALLGGHVVRNFSTVFAVVHHQHFQVSDVADNHLVKSIGQQVAGLLCCSEANVGHDNAASFELSAHPRIDTFGPAPAFLQAIQGAKKAISKQETHNGKKEAQQIFCFRKARSCIAFFTTVKTAFISTQKLERMK